MSDLLPQARSPVEAPIPEGTWVVLDEQATFLDRDLISGGSPWRLLRLAGSSRAVAQRWQHGGLVGPGEERFARTLVQQGLLHPHFASEVDVDEIDVIIPVFNDDASLETLLGDLEGFHVTIVDDGSLDAAEAKRCADDYGATLLRLHTNEGPSHARNAAALASSRPFLWFIDADVSVDNAPDVAQRLYAAFRDPLVAATAPRVQGPVGPTMREKFEQHFSPLDMGERSGIVLPDGPVGYVPSACLMVRRTAFGDGFDEELRVGEDVDFVWRLHDQGWLVRYDAAVAVTHRARTSWRAWWFQRQRYGASSGELARRHGARLAPFRSDRWTLLAWLSVLAGQPAIGGRIVGAARNHARAKNFEMTENPGHVANQIVARNMIRAGGPLARGVVRTFGGALLLTALHPRLRTRALVLFAVGTAWRWRHQRPRLTDIPLGVADDLAYGVGVVQGAWHTKSFRSLTPHVTKSSMGFREALGLPDVAPYAPVSSIDT
ncbi:MAG TPA: mycofactocin biosynthesis glycosyltransferase MftF [Acidimicrobiales bacterium]|nr:mycofactocin biosynthesis glycosyltransferase MftF [Acidimicrobiales bacterium]